ncbi:MAG: hypothetical protein R3F41_17030 [Gammaproteobacteria bacterium]|nr:hypothetical protein [Pseudomonadales bacterium]
MSPIWLFIIGFPLVLVLAVVRKWGKRPGQFYLSGVLCVFATVAAATIYDTLIRLPAARVANSSYLDAIENGENRVTEDNFFVFIGEPVEITPVENPNNEKAIVHYNRYDLSYRVLRTVWGSYDESMISFSAYDHYGPPPFINFRHVMLFVTKIDETWVHELYQWFPIYKTIDDDWAYCGNPVPSDWTGDEIDLQPIQFEPPVYFDTRHFSDEAIASNYPEPVWTIHENKVFCSMGVFTDDLFLIKREGNLHARGLF